MPEKILKPRLCREAIIPNNLVLCYLVQVETVSESVSEWVWERAHSQTQMPSLILILNHTPLPLQMPDGSKMFKTKTKYSSTRIKSFNAVLARSDAQSNVKKLVNYLCNLQGFFTAKQRNKWQTGQKLHLISRILILLKVSINH